MKEHPILFNDAMVRAILSGAKTQTRRPVKPEIPAYVHSIRPWFGDASRWLDAAGSSFERRCPYGEPSDLLYVREAHAVTFDHAPDDYPHVFYRADGAAHHDGRSICQVPDSPVYKHAGKWTPSIHMPRWASRLTLRVSDVRVERVQDISEADAPPGSASAWELLLLPVEPKPDPASLWPKVES